MRTAETTRVVLVTGAARRLGAAIARRLHAAGCRLALHAYRSGAELDALRGELEQHCPGSTLALHADLADPTAPARLVTQTLTHFARLDGLVNNAAIFHSSQPGSIGPAEWDRFMAVNARAPLLLCQAAAPALRESGGSIINISDYYANQPRADLLAYAASKAALEALTKGLARALAPHVRVNAVAPGAILWPEQGMDESTRQSILDATALARAGSPDDIAEAVHWLLHEAGYVNGQILHVDGGRRRDRSTGQSP